MSGFRYNQFALLSHEESDSDDSDYLESDPDALAGDHIDRVIPARAPLEVHQRWQDVRRKEPAVNSARRTQHTKGMLVMHVNLHYSPSDNAPRDQGRVVNLSRGGQFLEKKNRLFLVVGRLGNSLMECPILTYSDNGLRRRDEATWPEYCSIRPPHIPMEDFINQSPNNMVLDIDWTDWYGQMSEAMVVHLSDVRSRDTDDGVVVRGAVSPVPSEYASEKMADLTRSATTTARW
jgi:hypothetical protein